MDHGEKNLTVAVRALNGRKCKMKGVGKSRFFFVFFFNFIVAIESRKSETLYRGIYSSCASVKKEVGTVRDVMRWNFTFPPLPMRCSI